MTPSSMTTACVRTGSLAGGASTAPVRRLNREACSGHSTSQPLEPAVGQGGVLVRAGVVDGEYFTVFGVEDRDRRIGFHAARLSRRQFGEGTDLEHW